ncbi:ribonuclease H-like domain-containing protein [Candidatus Woesearchaeota archaeon]|nr:ribonuclease H-like domain-containing protein [Candidatus Woesearchaeota archaeon]
MMHYLFLDIETVPLDIRHEDVKLYLMDKKISKEDRSLNPLYAKIVVLGIKPFGGQPRLLTGDEKTILTEFWQLLSGMNTVLVTYNGYKFDVPFIKIRSVVNGVRIPYSINMNRWQMERSNHFDVMLFFSQQETFINPNLRVLGKMHGIESRDDFFGHDVERLYKEGRMQDIISHCQADIELLERIFAQFCKEYAENT